VDESLGKEGKGLVVIDGEALAEPESYGNDRIFLSMRLNSEKLSSRLAGLVSAGHPHIQMSLDSPEMIGQQFFLWQVAVATAAHVLGINPFDQPDVELSKQKSRAFLGSDQVLDLKEALEGEALVLENEQALVFGSDLEISEGSVENAVVQFAQQAGSGAYVGLLAYLDENPATTEILQSLRLKIRGATQLATTVGFGPSYLHASGQLHKGGSARARFVVLTPSIDGSDSETARLLLAQAAGDIQALREKGRQVLRVQLKSDLKAALTVGHSV
jgi:transaldolase/glucose-6-phosphate isomerase